MALLELIEALSKFLEQLITWLGYPGCVLFGFFGSIIPFIPVPYYVQVVLVAQYLDPFLVSLLSAFGAMVAKIIIFYAARYSSKLAGSMSKQNVIALRKVSDRYGWLAVFLVAATPVPDDMLYVVMGALGYNILHFIIAGYAGKLLITMFFAYGSRLYFPIISMLLDKINNEFIALGLTVTTLGATLLLLYWVYKLDWTAILVKYFPWVKEEMPAEKS
jgi:uncharacterized membrane protein YdjX (TVP38/TMEM64 family)